MALRQADEDLQVLQGRVQNAAWVITVFIAVVFLRLFYLQIHQGEFYRRLSEQTTVREEEVRAHRGSILDRTGRVLANSRAYFEIVAIPQYLQDKEKTLRDLAEILGVPAEELLVNYQAKLGRWAPYLPIPLIEDAPYEMVVKVLEYTKRDYTGDDAKLLDGIDVEVGSLRVYTEAELFAHALGYLQEINEEKLTRSRENFPNRYSRGDLMGASGLESTYDLELRGQDGISAHVVDARGHEVLGDPELSLLAERESQTPIRGQDLQTTLDYRAQLAASQALAGRRGAVVALEPNSGEVLALFSSPSFDANRILKNVDKAYWQKINLDEDKYLYNRTIQAVYPPGSIYKPVTALAGIMNQKISAQTSFYCGGGLQFGTRRFKCWQHSGHGTVDFTTSLAQSCDVFYYQIGNSVGVDAIQEQALRFGYGEKTGIDIPFEKAGLIPTKAWKQARYHREWIASETLSIAIGQGYDLVTPLQAAKMVAIIANGGRKIIPHLGRALSGQVIEYPVLDITIAPENLELIQKGLIEVVQGRGTATKLKLSPNKIAGKTGTAQVIGHDSKIKKTARNEPHGWFVAYAPYDAPKIAIAVIVENGGGGSVSAAPVAMKVIDAYLAN